MKNKTFDQYTDKYFLRSKAILQQEGLNPYVRAQVFVRKGPGVVAGLDEAVKFIAQQSSLIEHGGKIYALKDGDEYGEKETQMIIEGRIDDFIELETVYLGMIAKGITVANGGSEIDLVAVEQKTKELTTILGNKPLTYFGARHWHYSEDPAISYAAMKGGAITAATDAGAATFGKVGVGTIPHALENVYASIYGKENAVVEATKAFDKYMDVSIPRVALIDYNNKEVDDAVATAQALEGRLAAARIDTCGENVAQGALAVYDQQKINEFFGREVIIPQDQQQYWVGTGVTVTGAYAVRKALDDAGFEDVDIFLTSGFGSVAKTQAFIDAEKILGERIFDAVGAGSMYTSKAATMDIVAVGKDEHSLQPMSKVGREYQANERLQDRTMEFYTN